MTIYVTTNFLTPKTIKNTMMPRTAASKTIAIIAKIIETQYELNYIIPLIGEMIDKFMANLLTYIFIFENNSILMKIDVQSWIW